MLSEILKFAKKYWPLGVLFWMLHLAAEGLVVNAAFVYAIKPLAAAVAAMV